MTTSPIAPSTFQAVSPPEGSSPKNPNRRIPAIYASVVPPSTHFEPTVALLSQPASPSDASLMESYQANRLQSSPSELRSMSSPSASSQTSFEYPASTPTSPSSDSSSIVSSQSPQKTSRRMNPPLNLKDGIALPSHIAGLRKLVVSPALDLHELRQNLDNDKKQLAKLKFELSELSELDEYGELLLKIEPLETKIKKACDFLMIPITQEIFKAVVAGPIAISPIETVSRHGDLESSASSAAFILPPSPRGLFAPELSLSMLKEQKH